MRIIFLLAPEEGTRKESKAVSRLAQGKFFRVGKPGPAGLGGQDLVLDSHLGGGKGVPALPGRQLGWRVIRAIFPGGLF